MSEKKYVAAAFQLFFVELDEGDKTVLIFNNQRFDNVGVLVKHKLDVFRINIFAAGT